MGYIAYYRVSTTKQGQSGLGLEAQQSAIKNFLRDEKLIDEITEIESGKFDERPKLQEALRLCKKNKATLLIAKQDRLARRVSFVANLMESGVPFKSVENPNASPFELHIRASVDEEERRRISERTRQALAEVKKRGKKLGFANPERTDQVIASKKGIEKIKNNSDRFKANVIPIIKELKILGITTLQGIADALNNRGVKTARNKQWYPSNVKNVLMNL